MIWAVVIVAWLLLAAPVAWLIGQVIRLRELRDGQLPQDPGSGS